MSAGCKVITWLFALVSCDRQRGYPYTKTECIVKIDIESSLVGREYENMIELSVQAMPYARNDYDGPLPSLAVGPERNQFFLQYPNECERKVELTQYLINQYMQPAVSGNFLLTVSNDEITPVPNTIRVSGNAWIDSD